MVFWVIVYIDSYLYTEKKIATPLYMGVGGGSILLSFF